MSRDLVWDIECYPNLFCATFLEPKSGKYQTFEVSEWVDDWDKILNFVKQCQNNLIRWVGFNNYYYDYQVLHKTMQIKGFGSFDGKTKADLISRVSNRLIKMDKEEKFLHIAWDDDHHVPQVDLFRIHHFDNIARATSLKKLEFNMRSKKIQDLPYRFDTNLNEHQKNEVIQYNIHDVKETAKLYAQTADMIKFREELTKKYDKNFINHNDTKIGKDYFIMELEKAGINCFRITKNGREPIQTKRRHIVIKDIIFKCIQFKRPEFNAVLEWLEQQIITETKAVFTEIWADTLGKLKQYSNLETVKGNIKNLNCIVDGFQFDFGTGGIHGSVESTIVEEDEDFAIIDYDVTSLYPSIAIKHGVYPQHLTEKFCEIYGRLKDDRMKYPKGTPENAMLKLALNGVYGDSNNQFSPFYDPQYTMTITINGQLMLCMLAEMHLSIPGLKLIQINTDGVTVKVPRNKIDELEELNQHWQAMTGLQLERADYKKMFIRDVNNYVGLYIDGKLKRKGKYEYERALHQDQSALVIQKAVESHLVHNTNIEEFIKNHDNMFDFFLRTNVPRSSRLLIEYENHVEEVQNITRYYIAKNGGNLVKIMPALKQTKSVEDYKKEARTPAQIRDFNKMLDRRNKLKLQDKERIISINEGEIVRPLNEINIDFNELKNHLNHEWYINEAYKLVEPLWKGKMKDLLG